MRRFITWVPACLFMAACAVSPYQREVNISCLRNIIPCDKAFGEFCLPVMLIDLPIYGVCQGVDYATDMLTTASASVKDGVYKAPHSGFSVAVPHDVEGSTAVSYRGQQFASTDGDFVFFTPSVASAPAFAAGMRKEPILLPRRSLSGPLPDKFDTLEGLAGKSYSVRDEIKRIRDPLQSHLGERPAQLGIYAAFDGDSQIHGYYLIYLIEEDEHSTLLSVAWQGPCPACMEGSEAEIVASIPGAEEFVKSFHVANNPTMVTP